MKPINHVAWCPAHQAPPEELDGYDIAVALLDTQWHGIVLCDYYPPAAAADAEIEPGFHANLGSQVDLDCGERIVEYRQWALVASD